MKRFVAKIVRGSARLAFWRKPVEVAPDQQQSSEPASAEEIKPNETESKASVDVPVQQTGWSARLKNALLRRKRPDRESSPESDPALSSDQTLPKAPPSEALNDTDATADTALPPTLSLLARLKHSLRRQSRPEQLEADMAAENSSAENDNPPALSRDDDSVDDADAPHVSRIGRVLVLLSNKWVWIPGTSVLLLMIVVTMMLMLLQSRREKEQLQADLIAAQIKLKQAGIGKQVPIHQGLFRQAGDPAEVSAGGVADGYADVDTGNCDVSSKESVIKNLKNCIESFNKTTGR